MDLDGRRAIVTGGGGGIGAAIAKAMAAAGARVIAADIDGEKAAQTARALGDGHGAIEVDVTSAASVEAMVAAAGTQMGGIDVLVNSAGIVVLRDVLSIAAEDWRRVIEVNLIGTFNCCLAGAKAMVGSGGGSIINIGSVAAERASRGTTAYATSKGGVSSLTRALAVDLAARRIRVNAISPGPVETDMADRAHRPEFRAAYERMIPLGRYARAEEIATVAVFLASEKASYITGQVFKVDGGYSGAGVLT